MSHRFFGLGFVLLLTVALGVSPRSPSAQAATFEFVWASGMDRGRATATNSADVIEHDGSPGQGLMAWQTSVKRTGDGAYHFVGGNVSEKELVGGLAGKNSIFGGFEWWIGGAFQFESFPNAGLAPAWLLTAILSDGIVGNANKPVAAVTSDGKIRLFPSNLPSYAETANPVLIDKWYYLQMHGKYGLNETQHLFLYDGDTGVLLETLNLAWDTTGDHKAKIAKWGFGTNQNNTGVEFYLDDLFFSRGETNPGPIKVVPKTPNGTVANGGFTPVGAPTNHEAVDEFPTDGDTSYSRNASSPAPHQIEFDLSPALVGLTDVIYAVQTMVVPRYTGTRVSLQAGIKVGAAQSLSNLPLTTAYNARRAVHLTNPATGLAWTWADVNNATGVLRDPDTVPAEVRVTNAWWDVVYKMGGVP